MWSIWQLSVPSCHFFYKSNIVFKNFFSFVKVLLVLNSYPFWLQLLMRDTQACPSPFPQRPVRSMCGFLLYTQKHLFPDKTCPHCWPHKSRIENYLGSVPRPGSQMLTQHLLSKCLLSPSWMPVMCYMLIMYSKHNFSVPCLDRGHTTAATGAKQGNA